jgi:hypothetical protein
MVVMRELAHGEVKVAIAEPPSAGGGGSILSGFSSGRVSCIIGGPNSPCVLHASAPMRRARANVVLLSERPTAMTLATFWSEVQSRPLLPN